MDRQTEEGLGIGDYCGECGSQTDGQKVEAQGSSNGAKPSFLEAPYLCGRELLKRYGCRQNLVLVSHLVLILGGVNVL